MPKKKCKDHAVAKIKGLTRGGQLVLDPLFFLCCVSVIC